MLLAIDTSSIAGSVALIEAGGLRREIELEGRRDHGRALAMAVDALVGDALAEIQTYAISIGPGSFTGLRVGVSFLKGLALAHARPVIPVSSFEVLAAQAKVEQAGAESLLVVLDARGGEVYAQTFPDRRVEPGLHTVESVVSNVDRARVWVVGDAQVLPGDWSTVSAECAVPRARTVGQLAWPRAEAGQGVDVIDLEPRYHQRAAVERRAKALRDQPQTKGNPAVGD